MNRDGVLIIAEAGVNHNGDISLAHRLVDAAADAGADTVKFQTFVADAVVTEYAEAAAYQRNAVGDNSQREMLRRLQLDRKAHEELIGHCRDRAIQFCSTAFDDASIDLLHDLGMPFWKIPSGEITNLPYLRRIASFNQPVLLSTGMSTMEEVEAAVHALETEALPRQAITLMQCVTSYPAPVEDSNLRVLASFSQEFPGTSVGYSDHTAGLETAYAAAALGATVVEKHFTLDRSLAGPDQSASCEPAEFAEMVCGIRAIEAALGDGIKRPAPSECPQVPLVRRSLVAARPIRAGQRYTEENVTAKRPGTGLSPMLRDRIIGRCAIRNYQTDEMIDE